MRRFRRLVLGSIGLSALAARPAAAQRRERSWEATARVGSDFRYDDNPYLLTEGRQRRLDQLSLGDSLSRRFADMEGSTDLIPVPWLELGVSGPGLPGRALTLEAKVAYEANLENARRRHPELGLAIQQSLGRGGRLRLRADWRLSYFHKNYLTDAIDRNADRNITSDERRYSPAESNEMDLSLGYRQRLLKSTNERPVEISAELEAGHFDRAYDAFPGRDRSGPGAEIAVNLQLGGRWTVGLAYSYASLGADRTREVMILDENDFGVDLNGNGTSSDSSARAFELVNRSRAELELGASLQGELGKAVTAEVTYGRRTRNFDSAEPYDVSNRGRRDLLNEFAGELDLRVAAGLHLTLGARHGKQTTNRPGDPGATGDEADYSRTVATAGLRYGF